MSVFYFESSMAHYPTPLPLLCLNWKYKACSVQKVTFQNLLIKDTIFKDIAQIGGGEGGSVAFGD